MPNVWKTRHRSVRVSDEDWADLLAATESQDSDRGTAIKEFIAWYLHRPDAPRKLTRPDLSAWQRPASSEEKTG
jgi:hypothetical protein